MGKGRKTTAVRVGKTQARGKGLWSPLLCSLVTFEVVTGFVSPSWARGISPPRTVLLPTAKYESHREGVLPPLSQPIVELITPDGCSSQSSADVSKLVHNVKSAVAGGVKIVQLRDRKSDRRSISDFARRLRDATRNRAWFVVNGEPDAARAYGADGVHLPERMVDRLVDLKVSEEWPKVVGCSVHSVEVAVRAARLGASYLQAGRDGLEVDCGLFDGSEETAQLQHAHAPSITNKAIFCSCVISSEPLNNLQPASWNHSGGRQTSPRLRRVKDRSRTLYSLFTAWNEIPRVFEVALIDQALMCSVSPDNPSHKSPALGKVPEGVGLLSNVRRRLDAEGLGGVVLIGVGGIDRSNCGMIAAAGGDGVAAIRCLCDGVDPEGEAYGIVKALEDRHPVI